MKDDRASGSRSPAPLYCLFRHGQSWLAFAASEIREAVASPDIVECPGAPSFVVGITHLRSRFVPVLSLDDIVGEPGRPDRNTLLVMESSSGPWALLVDEVHSLEPLEVSDAPEADLLDESCLIVARASWENSHVRVLDAVRVYQRAEFSASDPCPEPSANDGRTSEYAMSLG